MHRTDDQIRLGPRVGEEHLAELAAAGDVADRPDVDAGLVRRHQKQRNPLVFRGIRIGPAQHVEPVGVGAERHPDLLAVDDPLVAVAHGPGTQARQVRSRARLGEALAPELTHARDGRQEAALLLVGAEVQQGRAEQVPAVNAHPVGRSGSRVLLMEDDLLGQRAPAPAVLPRPGDVEQPRLREQLLPLQPQLPMAVVRDAADARMRREFADQMLGQPVANLGPERRLLRVVVKLHLA